MSNTRQVALTGATGFIGSHILNLLLDNNYRVRILIRKVTDSLISHPNIEVIVGDLHHHPSLKTLTSNVDFIIHCAGRVRSASPEPFIHDNVTGTKNILSSITKTNQCKFILISSLSAREPSISDYANSKHASETALKQSHLKQWTIIRPPAVYGPGDRELKPLLDWMKRGVLWVPGSLEQKFSLLHIDDLSRLILSQLNSGTECGNTIEPDDGYQYNWPNIQQISEHFFHRKIRIMHIPYAVLSLVAHSNVLFSKAFNYSPMLTPGKVRELLHDNWVSEDASSISHWTPKVDFKIGLGTLYSSNDAN